MSLKTFTAWNNCDLWDQYERESLPATPWICLGVRFEKPGVELIGKILTAKQAMKTDFTIKAALIVALALILSAPLVQAFYNPSTGRWLSRDPAGERGGENLFGFVSNQPQNWCDNLGLAAWDYSELPPGGNWLVTLVEIDHPRYGGLHGFRSRYLPSVNPPCPCKKENIIMVQAVDSIADSKRMDNVEAVYQKYHHVKGTPFRDYYESVPDWVLRLRKYPLDIFDAPLRAQSEKDRYTWEFEDCAVCRTTSKDGTVVDQVLGCVRFNFVRHIDGTATLSPGEKAVIKVAEAPSSLWKAALKNWEKWTDE